jgi:shikimate kinase
MVGRRLAALLSYDFVDTDLVLQEQLGATVEEVVRQQGWQVFRRQEGILLAELRLRQQLIIASGGGAVELGESWKLLVEGSLVVWLRAEPATISERLRSDVKSPEQRPSLTGADPLEEIRPLLVRREPLYRASADLVVDTDRCNIDQISDAIIRAVNGEKVSCQA